MSTTSSIASSVSQVPVVQATVSTAKSIANNVAVETREAVVVQRKEMDEMNEEIRLAELSEMDPEQKKEIEIAQAILDS